MPIEPRTDGTVIARLTDDPGLSAQMDALLARPPEQAERVILDFTGVRYVNSSNIARLLRLRRTLIEKDGRLVLCGLGPQVQSVFDVTGLDKIFHFAADSAEAERATL
ncbi:MAG TPA: STAS domain-containing protein [Tepidisphaeraceae bacterium]|nr:STAS domain-containing protein [Tepidisphaeraceae bacterium]